MGIKLTFEQIPDVISTILERVENIEKHLSELKFSSASVSDGPLTVQEAAKFLSLSVPTIYTLIHKKQLPVFKRSKRCYFFRASLIEYIMAGHKKSALEIEEEVSKFNSKTT